MHLPPFLCPNLVCKTEDICRNILLWYALERAQAGHLERLVSLLAGLLQHYPSCVTHRPFMATLSSALLQWR